MIIPDDTVRGRLRKYLSENSQYIRGHVLEIGSGWHDPNCQWLETRDVLKHAKSYHGIDINMGHRVDQVVDAENMPFLGNSFDSILCSEVLEHVKRPHKVFSQAFSALRPNGWMVVTTLFSFPIHAFPSDYWRYTEMGLRVLFEDAGFVDIETASAGKVVYELNNHGDQITYHDAPMHVFARGRKP